MIKVLTDQLFWQLVETIYGEQRAEIEAANDLQQPVPANWAALSDTERDKFAVHVLFTLRLFQRFNEVPARFADDRLSNLAFATSQRFTGQAWDTAMPIPITVENAAIRDAATAQMVAFDEAEKRAAALPEQQTATTTEPSNAVDGQLQGSVPAREAASKRPSK